MTHPILRSVVPAQNLPRTQYAAGTQALLTLS